MSQTDVFRKIILQNELGGDEALAYTFSDPDGVRTGKSGWSFGVCQFDTQNNGLACLGLKSAGFSIAEVRSIMDQSCDIEEMGMKLRGASEVVDAMDSAQIAECLLHPQELCERTGVELGSPETLLHLADYHNQFYLSTGGQMHKFLLCFDRPVYPGDIYDLKMSQKWGRKRPDDVKRRFRTIFNLTQGQNKL